MERRAFLREMALLGAGLALGVPEGQTQEAPVKRRIRIGLQLYSVRQDCARDLPGTLARVAEMGYEGVEFAGYYGRSAEELRKMLDERGLKCCGTHTALNTLLGDALEPTIAFNRTLGNRYLVVPSLPKERTASKEAWLETARLFNELAEKVKPYGMQVGYHNHAIEFRPLEGEVPWDLFFSHTKPEVFMQLDTGNARHGGADPVAILKRYPGRALTLHLKAYSSTNPKALLGEDELDWKTILHLCATVGGTEWFIVEQESYPYPPLECVERCLKNLKRLLGE